MASVLEINVNQVCPFLMEKNFNQGPVIKIDRDIQQVKSDECEIGDQRVTIREKNPFTKKKVVVYQVSCDGCREYRNGFLDVYPIHV